MRTHFLQYYLVAVAVPHLFVAAAVFAAVPKRDGIVIPGASRAGLARWSENRCDSRRRRPLSVESRSPF